MADLVFSLSSAESPERVLQQRLAQFSAQVGAEDEFAVEFSFAQYFLEGAPEIVLLAVYRLIGCEDGVQVLAGVTDSVVVAKGRLSTGASLCEISDQLEFPLLDLAAPVRLQTVSIPKPWGQEIWYTGIEARGQSLVTDGRYKTPLPWWLYLAGQRLAAGREKAINLLKVLDPLPEEVYGDLYFELHEEKREVYVVTHVDEAAWPSGQGAIRFGFDQQLRQQYGNDEGFRADYLAAVKSYRAVREKIDEIFDGSRQQQGIALDAPVSAEQLKTWHAQLPAELQEREARLRAEMDRFTAVKKLRVGDVVKVPCLTPHALQHGVRTVEFQTPVYERKILSFAQKVLTQNSWDTDAAARLMSLHEPESEPLVEVDSGGGYRLESVVKFDDFQVFRLTLHSGCQWSVPTIGGYALLMNIDAEVSCNGISLDREQALFLPAQRTGVEVLNHTDDIAVLLLAQPL